MTLIPFAILSGRFVLDDGSSMEIRVLDLMPDGFTFRLPLSWKDAFSIEYFILHFFQYETRTYRKISLIDYDFCMEKKEKYWKKYRVSTRQADFQEASSKLSREYLTYIDYKLYLEDDQLSYMMTDYPNPDTNVFSKDPGHQMKKWAEGIRKKYKTETWDQKEYQVYLAMETPADLNIYLTDGIQTLFHRKWEESYLGWHPLRRSLIRGVLLGNSFCPHLLPELSMLFKVFRKLKEDQLKIIFSIPPVPESECDKISDYVQKICQYASQNSIDLRMQINDIGLWRQMNLIGYGHVTFSKGLMLHKHSKDPRKIYLQHSGNHSPLSSLDRTDDFIYLPYYQTNTSTFCILHALCTYSDRSHLERVDHCPEYCHDYSLVYEDHLQIKGKYNSLFGFHSDILIDGSYMEQVEREGKKVIINL